jgi:hypothetical protein
VRKPAEAAVPEPAPSAAEDSTPKLVTIAGVLVFAVVLAIGFRLWLRRHSAE